MKVEGDLFCRENKIPKKIVIPLGIKKIKYCNHEQEQDTIF